MARRAQGEDLNSVTAVQDGIGSFYVLGGFVYGPDEVTSAMYRFDEDTYEFVQLEQTWRILLKVLLELCCRMLKYKISLRKRSTCMYCTVLYCTILCMY